MNTKGMGSLSKEDMEGIARKVVREELSRYFARLHAKSIPGIDSQGRFITSSEALSMGLLELAQELHNLGYEETK